MSIERKANAIVALSVLFVISLFALTASGGPSPAVETSDILQSIREKHEGTHAIRATVYQKRDLAALKNPVYVEGTIILEKPGKLRWDAHAPEKSVTIINRDTMQVYYPDDREAEIHKLSDQFIARNTITFFGSVLWGDIGDMEKRFSVSMHPEGDVLFIRLEPRSKIMSRYLSSIIIRYNRKTGMPQGFEVTTPKGDRTVTTLKDLQINPEIGADTFVLQLAPDVRVRDYSVTVDMD
jgi:outer membrane lipoprotein-sorting protein